MPQDTQIIRTIKKVMPAVVTIVVSKKADRVEEEMERETPENFKEHMDIPPEKIDARGFVQVGGGSGFIANKKGIILTNKHVVNEPFAEYFVITNDGEKFHADILARDPIDDIAILKIEPGKHKLTTLKLGNSNKAELGETVLAFGNALGIFKSTVSSGIVSGLSRAIEAKPEPNAPAQEMRGLIQTDAAINPGNSGGPLTNAEGSVLGINAAVISSAQNIGFAIPVKVIERDLQDIKKHGKIKRPLLGVRYLTLTTDIKEKLKLPVNYGALITKENPLDIAIAPTGPAYKAGIKDHDIILEWNDKKITADKTIQDYLENAAVGDAVKLTILRGKKRLEKIVSLTERK
ncbi:hypothetical protein CL629_02455 [bacterium]|nr:hypothetical protein [bacterium]|tara:strand:+ start:775 stop:1818 length:1044 start_codon:yes stop_codon:yes gene_type:complete